MILVLQPVPKLVVMNTHSSQTAPLVALTTPLPHPQHKYNGDRGRPRRTRKKRVNVIGMLFRGIAQRSLAVLEKERMGQIRLILEGFTHLRYQPLNCRSNPETGILIPQSANPGNQLCPLKNRLWAVSKGRFRFLLEQ